MMTVAAQLSKERTPGKEEKPEDKAKLDKEFKEKQTKLEEKLSQEKAYEKWVYLVSSWSLDSLLKPRHELMAEKKDEKKEDAKKDDSTSDDAKAEEKPPVAPLAPLPVPQDSSKTNTPAAPLVPQSPKPTEATITNVPTPATDAKPAPK
jgi:hypothetical protein